MFGNFSTSLNNKACILINFTDNIFFTNYPVYDFFLINGSFKELLSFENISFEFYDDDIHSTSFSSSLPYLPFAIYILEISFFGGCDFTITSGHLLNYGTSTDLIFTFNQSGFNDYLNRYNTQNSLTSTINKDTNLNVAANRCADPYCEICEGATC